MTRCWRCDAASIEMRHHDCAQRCQASMWHRASTSRCPTTRVVVRLRRVASLRVSRDVNRTMMAQGRASLSVNPVRRVAYDRYWVPPQYRLPMSGCSRSQAPRTSSHRSRWIDLLAPPLQIARIAMCRSYSCGPAAVSLRGCSGAAGRGP